MLYFLSIYISAINWSIYITQIHNELIIWKARKIFNIFIIQWLLKVNYNFKREQKIELYYKSTQKLSLLNCTIKHTNGYFYVVHSLTALPIGFGWSFLSPKQSLIFYPLSLFFYLSFFISPLSPNRPINNQSIIP